MPHPIVFVDRDGTLIREPADYNVDRLEKLSFLPYALSSMRRLQEAGFRLVIVTNQDGLGTEKLPLERFYAVHNKMLEIFASEGVTFWQQLIDEHHEHENHPNRKPGTGMVQPLLQQGLVDLSRSFMLGDRNTDALFAQNLGIRSVTIKDPDSHDGDADIRNPAHRVAAPTHRVTSLPQAVDYILAQVGGGVHPTQG